MTSIPSLFAKTLSHMMKIPKLKTITNIRAKLLLIVSFKRLPCSPTQIADRLKLVKRAKKGKIKFNRSLTIAKFTKLRKVK
jgi:hypothetical protein